MTVATPEEKATRERGYKISADTRDQGYGVAKTVATCNAFFFFFFFFFFFRSTQGGGIQFTD